MDQRPRVFPPTAALRVAAKVARTQAQCFDALADFLDATGGSLAPGLTAHEQAPQQCDDTVIDLATIKTRSQQ